MAATSTTRRRSSTPTAASSKILATATEPKTEAEETVNGMDAYRVAVEARQRRRRVARARRAAGVTGKLWLDKQNKHLVKAVLDGPRRAATRRGTVNLDVSAINAPVTSVPR